MDAGMDAGTDRFISCSGAWWKECGKGQMRRNETGVVKICDDMLTRRLE